MLRKGSEALRFKATLKANPSVAQYWLSYIDALIKLDRIADAKAVFDQAKGNGAKGNGFDQIEKRFVGLERFTEVEVTDKVSQEPCSNRVAALNDLHADGEFKKGLSQASQLLKLFPKSADLQNIIGALNKGLGKDQQSHRCI